MDERTMLDWLNYWLARFQWFPDTRRCELVYRDMFGHTYMMDGADLRDCVTRAVAKHPDTLIPLPSQKGESNAR